MVAACFLVACNSPDRRSDEVLLGDRPLAWRVAETTPNAAGRKCSKDDLETYAARYYFENRAARLRYLERYQHCVGRNCRTESMWLGLRS
jgi:hypothetical protein